MPVVKQVIILNIIFGRHIQWNVLEVSLHCSIDGQRQAQGICILKIVT